MNRQEIEDKHIVDRYLLGQLSEAELCEFEAYYFEHPDMLEEVMIAKAMHETVRSESDALSFNDHLSKSSEQIDRPRVNWFERMFQPQLGFALSALLTIGIAGLWFENSQLKSLDNVVLSASSLTLSQTRGNADRVEIVKIAKDQSALAITLVTGPIGYTEVQLQLKDSENKLLWQGLTQVEGPVGTVNLVIATHHLSSQEYGLSVFSQSNPIDALSIYKFRVERF